MNPDAEKAQRHIEYDAGNWQENWPSAQLGGLTAVRLIVLPGPSGKSAESIQSPNVWHLTADPQPKDAVQITGELIHHHGEWFLSVAAMASVRFEPGYAPSMETDDELDEVLLRYGPWASHALWDYCRVMLLQATSAFPLRPTLEIPLLTPNPRCITRKLQKDLDKKKRKKKGLD